MELTIKLIVTVFILTFISGQIIYLTSVWKSHVDPKATAHKIFQIVIPSSSVLVKRNSNMIYQNGEPVGNVEGVSKDGDTIIFRYLCDSAHLDRESPFEYGREWYVISEFENEAMQQLVVKTDGSSEMRNDTLSKVICSPYKKKTEPED